jgi:hypothetical protein
MAAAAVGAEGIDLAVGDDEAMHPRAARREEDPRAVLAGDRAGEVDVVG